MKSKFSTILTVLVVVWFVACDKAPTNDNNGENGTVPQQHIPWPSLADSPWPMFHGDPQSTGRFSGKGPTQGEISSFFITEGENYGSVCIGHDDRVIITTKWENRLYVLSRSGELLWKKNIFAGGAPIVTSDSLIITGSADGILYCLDEMTGEEVWSYDTGKQIYSPGIISREGIILIYAKSSDGKEILAFKLDGTLLWRKDTPGIMGYAFSPDGSTFYTSGPVAYDLDGVELWSSEYRVGYPCVDNAGNIYGVDAINDVLVSLEPDGSLRWVIYADSLGIEKLELDVSIAPSLDIDGNFIAAGFGAYLISVTNNGEHRWTISLGDSTPIVGTHLVSDNEGTVFVSGWIPGSSVSAINQDGSVRWSIIQEEFGTYGSPGFDSGERLFLLPDWHEHPAKLRMIR